MITLKHFLDAHQVGELIDFKLVSKPLRTYLLQFGELICSGDFVERPPILEFSELRKFHFDCIFVQS